MGEAINLAGNFKVEKVIFNCGEYNDLEKELIKVLEKKKILYITKLKNIIIRKAILGNMGYAEMLVRQFIIS